jgi:hypothetical protein
MKNFIIFIGFCFSLSIHSQIQNAHYGTGALNQIVTGHGNGSRNSAFGVSALFANTSGSGNSAFGRGAMRYNMSGAYNTASGIYSLFSNTTGSNNSAYGNAALRNNTTGDDNTASGVYALHANKFGSNNVAYGNAALRYNTSGSYNTAVGGQALYANTTGSNNSVFGYNARVSISNATNQTVIGYEATGQVNNSVVLGNSDVTAVYMGEDSGATVYAGPGNFNGDLTIYGDAMVLSDARLKTNIMSLGPTLAKLLLIDGKIYTMKNSVEQKIGVLAQDIQKVFPQLVSKVNNEKLAVNYQGLVPILINAMKEQQQQIEQLKKLVLKLTTQH